MDNKFLVRWTVRLEVEDDWDEVSEMEVNSFDEFLTTLGVTREELQESIDMGLCQIIEPTKW